MRGKERVRLQAQQQVLPERRLQSRRLLKVGILLIHNYKFGVEFGHFRTDMTNRNNQ